LDDVVREIVTHPVNFSVTRKCNGAGKKKESQPEMIIDGDSHIIEPADTWTARMSQERWGSLVPHVRYDEEANGEYWYVGDSKLASVGHTSVERGPNGEPQRVKGYELPRLYTDMHPSAFDSSERIKVMDSYGINAAVLYPDIGLFVTPRIQNGAAPQTGSLRTSGETTKGAPALVNIDNLSDYRHELIRAYNDFVADWIAVAPERFVALISIPFWDVPGAVSEIERCSALGFKGIITTGAPQVHGQPYLADRHWDPIWEAAQAHSLSVSFHVGGGDLSMHSNAARLKVEGALPMGVRTATSVFFDNAHVLADLLMSGILPRFPDLQFVNVESGVGWIPFCLESLDYHFKQYEVRRDHPQFELLPSEYFRRQVYCTYWFEDVTDEDLAKVGKDRILFETDYPHPTCLIGDAVGEALKKLDRLSPELRDLVLYQNAAHLYDLDLASTGVAFASR
jgi:uncharacterized protein